MNIKDDFALNSFGENYAYLSLNLSEHSLCTLNV